jgi:hypothetical protein
MESRWALDRDRAHGIRKHSRLRYFPGSQTRGFHMFGEERSYFRYVVLGLVGLMFVGFFFMGAKG